MATKRLIDANKVINSMQKCLDEEPTKKDSVAYFAFESIIECLKREPTVDAVEVVRCKECKHYCSFYNECSEEHNHYTEEGFREVHDNDFCSYGERKIT